MFLLRWNNLLENISEQLKSSKALLVLWQHYQSLYSQCLTAVQKQEERADHLLRSATDKEITEEESGAWIQECNVRANFLDEQCFNEIRFFPKIFLIFQSPEHA